MQRAAVLQLNFDGPCELGGTIVEEEEEESNAFQELLDEMTPIPPQVQMEENMSDGEPVRPQRERRQTHLYQGDEVALLDKRVVKD